MVFNLLFNCLNYQNPVRVSELWTLKSEVHFAKSEEIRSSLYLSKVWNSKIEVQNQKDEVCLKYIQSLKSKF